MPHYAGLSTWIGIAKSVPLAVIDMIQAVLQAAGMEVERDMGRAIHLELNPFARLCRRTRDPGPGGARR